MNTLQWFLDHWRYSLNLIVILGNKDKKPYDNNIVHVIIGTIFISVGLFRLINYHLTDTHHQGHEAAILYWHFVDVVWLFLFVAVYYWGGA
jgi:hypothetical protein